MLPEDTVRDYLDLAIEDDPDDPQNGPPESWPWWTDLPLHIVLGPDPREGAVAEAPYEPTPADLAWLDDLHDRMETEQRLGINARFADDAILGEGRVC